MTQANHTPSAALPISAVERETGLTKDVLRKWESRYGFPQPGRDSAGERLYPSDQVARLRLIKRLLDAGMRPAHIVGLSSDALTQLAQGQQAESDAGDADEFQVDFLRLLRQHDAAALRQTLSRELYREGLQSFVQDRIARLAEVVGDAWARGALDIHEEHLFSEVVDGLLRDVIREISPSQGQPRILLTTLPGEPHGLGLLMVAALASLEGAYCLSLGPQTPPHEIRTAVEARTIDIVALSFSNTFPARQVFPALTKLRAILPEPVAIWVGGGGVPRRTPAAPGITLIPTLSALPTVLTHWRCGNSQPLALSIPEC